MNKKIIGFVLASFFALHAGDYTGKIGLSFTVFDHTEAGLKVHVLPNYCVNPSLYFENRNVLKIGIGNQIYFFPLGLLDQYVNLKLDFEQPAGGDGKLGCAGNYGLQYLINEAIAVFGEAGLRMGLSGENNLSFFHTDLGVTFFLR